MDWSRSYRVIKGPEAGVRINLVGGKHLVISGDKVKMDVDIATNMGIKTSIQDILILENDAKSLVMGVKRHTSLVGEQCGDSVSMVNIDTFRTKLSNPLESTEDKAEEDRLLDDTTIEVYPESKIEGLEPHNQCFFDPDFPDQKSLREIVEKICQVLFQPFDQEGLRVDSLCHMEIDPNATFRMQPCRFIRSDIFGPLKVMIDQFVSEGAHSRYFLFSCEYIGYRA